MASLSFDATARANSANRKNILRLTGQKVVFLNSFVPTDDTMILFYSSTENENSLVLRNEVRNFIVLVSWNFIRADVFTALACLQFAYSG